VGLTPIHGEVFINFLFISINENNWFAESMFFVGVHSMDFDGLCGVPSIADTVSTVYIFLNSTWVDL
jgi:hypothetical protein